MFFFGKERTRFGLSWRCYSAYMFPFLWLVNTVQTSWPERPQPPQLLRLMIVIWKRDFAFFISTGWCSNMEWIGACRKKVKSRLISRTFQCTNGHHGDMWWLDYFDMEHFLVVADISLYHERGKKTFSNFDQDGYSANYCVAKKLVTDMIPLVKPALEAKLCWDTCLKLYQTEVWSSTQTHLSKTWSGASFHSFNR